MSTRHPLGSHSIELECFGEFYKTLVVHVTAVKKMNGKRKKDYLLLKYTLGLGLRYGQNTHKVPFWTPSQK